MAIVSPVHGTTRRLATALGTGVIRSGWKMVTEHVTTAITQRAGADNQSWDSSGNWKHGLCFQFPEESQDH